MDNKPPVSVTKLENRSSVLTSGDVLQGRYRIVQRLGSGGMGAVYEAVDERLDTTVALKETFSLDSRLRRQFEQEARLLAGLHHSALPRVSDYFTEGDRAFLVMQYISGADLAEIIATQPGPFPLNQVIAWADQLLDALVYLHTRDRQIIHRDIKPHNLKVTANGQIALLDFGLAKAESADASAVTSSTSIFGYTRRYSPLEQIHDQGTSPRSDIYALGATLYHLLTGVKPPDALARAAAVAKSKTDLLKPAHEVHPAVGSEIAVILGRAMALEPEGRFQSASDFREALRRVGRKENSQRKETAITSGRKSTNDCTVNTTVVGTGRVAEVDPFDSYSILKPHDDLWLIPKPTRAPAVLVAILLILLAGGFVTFYGLNHWDESAGEVVDYAKANPKKDSSGTNTVRTNKPDAAHLKPSSARNGSTDATGEAARKNNGQKRRTLRATAAPSKVPALTPPPVSLLP
ncbi:MAG TPA: serine/threonine-protein kinase [Pyrinomonadaceae bacterium]|nr:serine/threonine-protein kinase [Pyrinomonadaceae bacterium]